MNTSLYKRFFIFIIGAILYGLIEIIFRGYTHWTMLIAGGICLNFIYSVCYILKGKSTIYKSFISCLFITGIEFYTGAIVNIFLGWNVWDYSFMKINLLGQICLLYSFLWFILCIPTIICIDKIRISQVKRKKYSF